MMFQEQSAREGGHKNALSGTVIYTPDSELNYKVILTLEGLETVEHGFATSREADAFIRRNTPAPAPRSTAFDRPRGFSRRNRTPVPRDNRLAVWEDEGGRTGVRRHQVAREGNIMMSQADPKDEMLSATDLQRHGINRVSVDRFDVGGFSYSRLADAMAQARRKNVGGLPT